MNQLVWDQLAQLPSTLLCLRTAHALSMQMYAGLDSCVGYTVSKNAKILVGDSALANLVQAMTTPHGAQIVSTQ